MDNTTTIDLSLANIERAASIIDPVFRDTPQFIDEQLCAALGRRTIVKVETAILLAALREGEPIS